MKSPKVSIIVPCYNQADFLKECLDSVMVQTFQDFEVIVVDDGSTDPKSIQVLKTLEYPKTRIIHQKNMGLVGARNTGISQAKGEYIFPLDSDDKISPITLEKAVDVLNKNPKVGIVSGKTKLFGAKSGIFDCTPYKFPDILTGNCLVCSCMFRRSDWEKVGGYNPNMKYGWEDYDFWLSLIELGVEVYQVDDVFLYYRQNSFSMITKLKKERQKMMVRQIILNHPNLYQKYPKQRKKLIRLHSDYYVWIKFFIKMICPIVPVKSWRHKLRSIYRKG